MYTESWLRWTSGAARESEDQLPYSGHDGPRQSHHHPRQACQLWFHAEHNSGQEILHPLQTV